MLWISNMFRLINFCCIMCSIAAISVIYPIFWILWEVLYAPIRLVLGFCSLVGYLCTLTYELVGDLLLFASSLFNLTRNVESTVSSYEVSVWRSLWNDLFSQVVYCNIPPLTLDLHIYVLCSSYGLF